GERAKGRPVWLSSEMPANLCSERVLVSPLHSFSPPRVPPHLLIDLSLLNCRRRAIISAPGRQPPIFLHLVRDRKNATTKVREYQWISCDSRPCTLGVAIVGLLPRSNKVEHQRAIQSTVDGSQHRGAARLRLAANRGRCGRKRTGCF